MKNFRDAGDLLSFPVRNANTLNYLKFLKRIVEKYLTLLPDKIFPYRFKK